MLRAGAEASGLRLVSNSVAMKSHEPLPVGFDAVVGLGEDALTIRLRSRKNALFGQTIMRSCTCRTRSGVVAHAPAFICPVHVFGRWVIKHVPIGGNALSKKIARD